MSKLMTNHSNFRGLPTSYFMWLVDIVCDPDSEIFDHPKDDYLYLMSVLADRAFDSFTANLVPNDDNRIADGLHLRHEFGKSIIDEYDGPCSVLELLIGVARRMNDCIAVSPTEDNTKELFWELLYNLGFTKFDNYNMSNPSYAQAADDILTVFCERLYEKDGTGGIFPLRNPPSNQVKTEIWYQMMAYLDENYPI